MEYDRALFRVYERIMEDLNASPSPLALPSSSSSAAGATGAATSNDAAETSPSLSRPRDGGGLRRRRRGGQQRQGGDQGQDDASAVAASPAAGARDDEDSEPDDVDATGQGDDDNDPASPESERSTTNDTNNREGRRRRRARQGPRHIPILARRQFSTIMQQQRRHEPLPFVLPIWMVRKMERMNHSFLGTRMAMATDPNSGFFVRLWSNVREIVLGRTGSNVMQHSSYDSVATSPSQQPRIPSSPSSPISTMNYRSLSISPGAASPNNHRDDSNPTNEHTSQSDVEEGERSSLQLRLPPLNTDHNQSTPTRSSSSVVGLRRRSPSRRGQYNHQEPPSSPTSSHSSHSNNSRRAPPRSPVPLQPRLGNSPSSSSSASTSLSSRQSGEEPESTANNNRSGAGVRSSAPIRTLAQRAIQMQLRQNERFSSQGRRNRRRSNRRDVDNEDDGRSTSDDSDSTSSENSDDSSSSEEDGDDDNDRRNNNNEGCSQHNLYGAMRLSFAIAIFHIFVLISLHVTYVGPYAFRRQTTTVSVNQRWRRLVTKIDGGRSSFVRGLLLGDEAEQEYDNHDVVDQKDATTMLVNCISYALSTRPIGDRSTYFGEDKDKSSSDGDSSNGRRVRVEYDEDDLILDEEEWDDDEMYYLHDGYDQLPQFGNSAIRPSLAVDDAIDDDEYEYNIYQQRAMSESSTSGGSTTKTVEPKAFSSPLLGKDEVLQIKIMYGGKCTGRCSRVHKVEYPEEESITETDKSADAGANNSTDKDGESENEGRSLSQTNLVNGMHDGQRLRGLKQVKQNERQAAEKKGDDNGRTTKDNDPSSPSYWEKVHYRYAIDDALLYLDEKSALLHNITVVNVTVTERCLSTGSDDGKLSFLTAIGEFLSQVYGMDSIIINQLMYGIRGTDGVFTSGYVKSMETQERWGWHKEQLEAFEHGSFMEWVLRKFGVILMSTLAFFLITSVTSLIVRVLTSSGVVLMFPLFAFFRAMGMPGADERILSLSYPWIGSARVAIANQHVHPQSHLVWAHVTKIILYYVMYEACQAAWSVVLYAKSIPEALPVWIYGFAMIWEYFSMVFVRSALSAHFFPRLTFLYFLLYHIYFYSIPYGYFDVALIPLFLFMLHAMLYTILGLEAPNAARGVVNVECPREVYNRLSWHEPVAALPAEWTMFLPLNSRLSPLHDRVSDTPTNDANNNDRWEGDGNAAAG